MWIKDLMKQGFKDNIYSDVVTIECINFYEMKTLLKILDSLGFKWSGGQSLLGSIERDYRNATIHTFNGSAYIGIMYFRWWDKDCDCIGYRADLTDTKEREKVKTISYRHAIKILKEVKKGIKNAGIN